MERSWVKHVVLAVVAFVMRLAGMRLKEDPAGPADEYSAHGVYRTPQPPTEPPPPTKRQPGLLSRLWLRLRSLKLDSGWRQSFVVAFAAAAVMASIWGIYFLLTGDVPEISGYQLTPDNGNSHHPLWVFALPFAVSRWWDVAFFSFWALALARLIRNYREDRCSFDEGAETGGLLVGIFGAILGTAVTACCVGCNQPTQTSGVEVLAVGTVTGAFAAGLIAPVASAFLGSIIATIGAGLGAGLRTCWSTVLLGGIVAGIVFGVPGGLLYCFVAGTVITVFNLLLHGLISLGKNDYR